MPEPIVAYYWETLPGLITVGLAALAALLLAIAIGWLWWRWPKRKAARLGLENPKDRADVEDNYRKTVGQALGGIVLLLGAGSAYLQFLQQQQAARDLLISNQVSKGFEQLGSEKIVVRIGGVYALEGVMNGSDEYHRPVLEALSAFVREGAKLRPTTPPSIPLPTDIQAALTVIGRRSDDRGIFSIDLADANLSGAALIRARLNFARLVRANLSGAELYYAELSVALLVDADLSGADLTGADLSGADLTNAKLIRAELTGADLHLTMLRGAKLGAARLGGADLTDAKLIGADLSGAQIEQKQLDVACGSDAVLPMGLTLKPCPAQSPP